MPALAGLVLDFDRKSPAAAVSRYVHPSSVRMARIRESSVPPEAASGTMIKAATVTAQRVQECHKVTVLKLAHRSGDIPELTVSLRRVAASDREERLGRRRLTLFRMSPEG